MQEVPSATAIVPGEIAGNATGGGWERNAV